MSEEILNSPEYQEYKLKVEMIDSLRASVIDADENLIPVLEKKFFEFCKSVGHDYGEEIQKDSWTSIRVSSHVNNHPATYNLPDKDIASKKIIFVKTCRYCGVESKRDAVVSYK